MKMTEKMKINIKVSGTLAVLFVVKAIALCVVIEVAK